MAPIRALVIPVLIGMLFLASDALHPSTIGNVASALDQSPAEQHWVQEDSLVYPLWAANSTPMDTPPTENYAPVHVAAATDPDGRIYALGNYDGTSSPKTGLSSSRLSYPRAGLVVATGFDGQVYAIGGQNSLDDDRSVVSIVEAYSPAKGRWLGMPNMPTARSNLAATVGRDGRVFAIGGQNGSYLNTVESLAPAAVGQAWVKLAPMPTARADLVAVTGLDGRVYALGGRNKNGYLSTAEVYDPAAGQWTGVANMPNPRAYLDATVGSDGRIYAIGGVNSHGTVSTTDVYDPRNNTWTTIAASKTNNKPLSPLGTAN